MEGIYRIQRGVSVNQNDIKVIVDYLTGAKKVYMEVVDKKETKCVPDTVKEYICSAKQINVSVEKNGDVWFEYRKIPKKAKCMISTAKKKVNNEYYDAVKEVKAKQKVLSELGVKVTDEIVKRLESATYTEELDRIARSYIV